MTRLRTLTIACCFFLIAGAASAAPSVTLDAPKAGIDYPTDRAVPKQLAGAKILTIDGQRIVVDKKSVLKSAKLIVLEGNRRIAITLEAPKAGIDYPTDAPAPKGSVWVFGNAKRLPVASIASLEHAVAGIDFPTDGPPMLDRNFDVAVMKDGKRHRIQ